MSPEPNPAHLLSPERLAEIRAQLDLPRARNAYVTDYGVAADVVEELSDHIAAREAQVKQVLAGLLLAPEYPAPEPGERTYALHPDAQKEVRAAREEARQQRIRATAKELGIDL